MRKLLVFALVAALVVAASLAGCKQRTVRVLTGEIVLCTAGEIIEDNTEEVEVPESEAADHAVTTRVITCDDHGGLASLWDRAQAAIAAGDLVAARERLQAIVDQDSTYRNAKQQLDDITAGRTPTAATGGSTGGGTVPGTAPGDETPTGPVLNLAKYIPDVIDGYTAQGIIADPATLMRQYIPQSGNADQLFVMVEQTVDAAGAARALDAFKADYPESAKSVTVAGRQVSFGTKGSFAAAAFTDGPVIVVVELHAARGAARDLESATLAVVGIVAK